MKLKILGFIFLSVASISCASNDHKKDQSVVVINNEHDAIRETVFKYLFHNNESGNKGKVSVYCISISKEEQDPSVELLQRFRSYDPQVKPASACYFKPVPGDPIGTVVDKATEKPGILFYIESISIKGSDRAIVKGGYIAGSLSAAASTYYLNKKKDKWMVSKEKLQTVS